MYKRQVLQIAFGLCVSQTETHLVFIGLQKFIKGIQRINVHQQLFSVKGGHKMCIRDSVYGIGAFSLSKDIGVSVKEADAFIKNYFANFPGVKKYLDETVEQGRENGYVTTLYGRRRTLPELASSNFNVRSLGERMAMNTPIQGTAADIIKLAMVRVYRRLKAEGLRARLILQVHDELIVECPAEEKERAAKVLGEEMRGAAELRVPLSADVNSGTTWYAAKG